jgi:hypothetical protein
MLTGRDGERVDDGERRRPGRSPAEDAHARAEADVAPAVRQGAAGLSRSYLVNDDVAEREVTILLAEFAVVWNELFPVEQARIVQLLVERVDVHEDALEVRVRAEGLRSLIGELRQQGEKMAA